jgi:hypothetical protein
MAKAGYFCKIRQKNVAIGVTLVENQAMFGLLI